jgi:hypothetical protein
MPPALRITAQSQVISGMQPTRQHEVRLVITRKLRPPHAPRQGGRRFPPPRFRSRRRFVPQLWRASRFTAARPAVPPSPRRAPRPGLRYRAPPASGQKADLKTMGISFLEICPSARRHQKFSRIPSFLTTIEMRQHLRFAGNLIHPVVPERLSSA